MIPPFQCLAQCPPGLEPLLLGELRTLGVDPDPVRGGAEWEGNWPSLLRANLELRVAGRVLVTLTRFRARALGELERKAGAVAWDESLPPGPTRFRVAASRSRINHGRAVAERLHRVSGRPSPGPPEAGADPRAEGTLVLVRIHRDEVTIRLDASGDHLHRRGYRTDAGDAPLRETLAAAALLATGWDGNLPLADPFCGAGTIPLEAALLARRIPPALSSATRVPRGLGVHRWPGFPEGLWEGLAAEARARILPRAPGPVLGSDRDSRVVEAARANAERAGLTADVALRVASATAAPLPADQGPGWIVTNPPHGVRLGDRRRLRRLYSALGRAARDRWRNWGFAVLSADPVLAGHLALPLSEAFRTRHGGREVRLLVRDPAG